MTSKTLILNAAPLLHHRKSHLSALLLRLVCWLLPKLGYRFTTLSDAAAPGAGRSACLILESSSRLPLEAKTLALFDRLALPVTLFVATAAITEKEGAPGALNWPLLRDLIRRTWEIGVLGDEAVDLTTRSYGEQRQLIARARAATTRHLGRTARSFAYPFGAYDATTVSCLKEEGFVAAVSAHAGANPAGADRFQLRQLTIAGPFLTAARALLRHALASSSPASLVSAIKSGSDRDHVRSRAAL